MSENGKVTVDINLLTLRDLRDVEAACGKTMSTVLSDPDATALAALIWVTRRKDDPAFTLEHALDLPVSAYELAATSPKDAAS